MFLHDTSATADISLCFVLALPIFRGVIQTVLSTGLAVASHVIPAYRLVFVVVTAAILSCNILAFDKGYIISWFDRILIIKKLRHPPIMKKLRVNL